MLRVLGYCWDEDDPSAIEWVKRFEREIAERLKALERENRDLRQVNEILRYFASRPPVQAMIAFIGSPQRTGSSRSARCCRSPRRRP